MNILLFFLIFIYFLYFKFSNSVFTEQLIDIQNSLPPSGNHVQFVYPFAFELHYSESHGTRNEKLYKWKFIKPI